MVLTNSVWRTFSYVLTAGHKAKIGGGLLAKAFEHSGADVKTLEPGRYAEQLSLVRINGVQFTLPKHGSVPIDTTHVNAVREVLRRHYGEPADHVSEHTL